MDTLSYKTISANKATVTKEWVIVDATDQVLGRLGAKVAKLLRGKYKPNFTPHVDCGDNVIIINADKVKFTGNKWNDKVYLSYTGYPGGQREITPARLMAKPNGAEKLMKKVVKGMLPKNRLGAKLLGNLYVYASDRISVLCRPTLSMPRRQHRKKLFSTLTACHLLFSSHYPAQNRHSFSSYPSPVFLPSPDLPRPLPSGQYQAAMPHRSGQE